MANRAATDTAGRGLCDDRGMTRVRAYTDGACSGNPGPGGWAWVVPGGAFESGAASHTTNQRMELQAVLSVVETINEPLHVVSDSTYVVNCFRDSWWKGWLKRGWKNSQKKPVANRDLWQPLIELYQERDVTFEWVKGHSGDQWNDVADRLCVEAAQSQSGRRGDDIGNALASLGDADVAGPPVAKSVRGVGAAPKPKKAAASGPPPVEGHLLVVGGHRPPEIGGWDPNPVARRIRSQLTDIVAAKAQITDNLKVVTGMGLGAEQLGAEAAIAAEVPFVAVLAFPDPSSVWPKASQKRFDDLLDQAADVVVLQKAVPDSKTRVALAMKKRDAWFGSHAHEAVIVWDRKERFVGGLVKSLEGELGDRVWVVDPTEIGA